MLYLNDIKKITKIDSVYLDLFRAVSAQLVLIGHLLSKYGFMDMYKMPKVQNFGVLVFFVLSGFLISHTSLLKGKSYSLKNYLIDRFSRIYSAFLPALIFIFFVDCIMHFEYFEYNSKYDFSIKSFFCNVFMLQSHPIFINLNITSFGSARPFWTVSIEWFYYIFFGLMFFLSFKLKSLLHYFMYIFLLLFSGYVALYYIGGRGGGLTYYWLFGFLLALAYNNSVYIKNVFLGSTIIFTILVLLSFRYRMLNSTDFYDITLAFLIALLLLGFMKVNNVFNMIINRPSMIKVATFLASFSFSLYLIHFTLIDFLRQIFNIKYQFLELVILFILINIISYVFYWFFERHHLKFRNKLKEILVKF